MSIEIKTGEKLRSFRSLIEGWRAMGNPIKVLKDLEILWSVDAIDIKVLKDLKSIPKGPREHPSADWL